MMQRRFVKIRVFSVVVAMLSLLSATPVRGQDQRGTQPSSNPAAESSQPPRWAWAFSERVRYSGLFNQFRPGLSEDDRALVFRSTLKVEYAWPAVTITGELQDARAYLTDENTYVSPALINPVDLLQAYASFTIPASQSGPKAQMQLGRFAMELGSGRLIAQEAYRDVTRTFTGAKLRWPIGTAGAVTGFAVLPVITRPENREQLLRNSVQRDSEHLRENFLGGLYEHDRLRYRVRGEAYLYALNERDEPGTRETRDRRVWTAGFRLFRSAMVGAWDADLESAWQRGRAVASAAPTDRRELNVASRLFHMEAGYTFNRKWQPRLAVQYDYGSGDANPNDDQWNRFDSLFGHRRLELGPTSIYTALGRENIDTAAVRLAVTPHRHIDAFAVYRTARLAAASDAFASTGVRDPTGGSGRNAGHQIDARLRAWLSPDRVRLDVGVTHLIAGHFLQMAPNATREGNTTFFYADVTYSFTSRPSASALR